MELSKLKLELYDLAAIILPGFFLIGELLAPVKGLPPVFVSLQSVSGAELTLLIHCSFALGNLVQEAGDRLIKQLKWDNIVAVAAMLLNAVVLNGSRVLCPSTIVLTLGVPPTAPSE